MPACPYPCRGQLLGLEASGSAERSLLKEFYRCDEAEREAGSHGLFQELGREEASREIQRISRVLQTEQPPQSYDFLCRTFLFSSSTE